MNINKKQRKIVLLGLLFVTGVASVNSASGQQSVVAADQGLQEVIVSARKREERLQDVPISITAFTADAIEQRGIESVYDIGRLTPNLSFNQTYGRVFDRPVIRGMSQILGERTVSFIVDGVYIAGNITGADLDDIETVEVLKGPQATNFGRGSLAGVISYRTTPPSNEFKGKGSVSVGDDGFGKNSNFAAMGFEVGTFGGQSSAAMDPPRVGRLAFQVGASANQYITIDLADFGKKGSITGDITGDVDLNVEDRRVRINTREGASAVLTLLDDAMDKVNATRATMGAVMNRMQHVINNLSNVTTNLSASRSQIEDADYAAASTELAKTQIMQQAATAVLAQANTSQQTVLKLLQG